MKTCEDEHNKEIKDDEIQSVMLDDRKDFTKTIVHSEDGKLHQRDILEDHYCFCSEPGGKYLFHFVNNPEERRDSTSAEHIAQQLFEWNRT